MKGNEVRGGILILIRIQLGFFNKKGKQDLHGGDVNTFMAAYRREELIITSTD